MAEMFGSMTEVTEVMVNPSADLNATFPPSEWVDALLCANNFSPICEMITPEASGGAGADILTC